MGDFDAVDFNAPFGWLHQAEHVFGQDGFATTRGSEQAEGFAPVDIEVDTAEDVVFPEILMEPPNPDERKVAIG